MDAPVIEASMIYPIVWTARLFIPPPVFIMMSLIVEGEGSGSWPD